MAKSVFNPEQIVTEFLDRRHTEQAVAEVLHEIDDHPSVDWVPLGREPNNYSIVENQQSNAFAAFTELVVNSIDAIILRSFFKKHGDSYSGSEYSSLDEAANDLIVKEEDTIEVTATGKQNGPFSLTLYDNGCGQPPEDFDTTFLNVLTPGEIKQEFDFLQGKYGMGSTGVLPFCGDRGYKLIASAGYDKPKQWSWSIIRKNRDKNQYEYLTVNGIPPQFNGVVDGRNSGTYIKCFEYQSEVKSTITKRFRHRLERYITTSPVPIQLNETRYDGYGSPYTEGLLPSIWSKKEYIKGHDRIEHTFDNDILGTKDIEIFLMKAEDQLEDIGLSKNVTESFVRGSKQTKQAILFTYNGQTHGDQGQTFIRRRCNLRQIYNDTLVVINFSDVDDADIVDLFKPSRDRLQEKEPAKVLKNELEDILKKNDMLLEEEERRRTKDIEENTDELEEDILEEILQRNPALKGYLKEGEKKPAINKNGNNTVDYEGNFYPEKFNIIKKYRSRTDYEVLDFEEDSKYTVRIPSNKTSLQRFELDAANDYLTRDNDSGCINIQLPSMVKSKRLRDGILTLRLAPPNAFSPGDNLTLEVEISPTQGTGSMTQQFRVEIMEPVQDQNRTTNTDDNDVGVAGFELPDAHWIGEENWEKHGFDEHSIVKLLPSPEGEMSLLINEDAAPLVNFRQRHSLKKSGKEYVKQTYKLGMILYSVGQYIEITKDYDDDPQWEVIDPVDVVETSMRGIAQSFLDQTIDDEKIREITY